MPTIRFEPKWKTLWDVNVHCTVLKFSNWPLVCSKCENVVILVKTLSFLTQIMTSWLQKSDGLRLREWEQEEKRTRKSGPRSLGI